MTDTDTDGDIDTSMLHVTREIDRLTGAGLEHKGWRIVPGGTLPRDSTYIDRSNHRQILRLLVAASDGNPDEDYDCIQYVGRDDDHEHYDSTGVWFGVASFGHFAFGHISEIVISATWDAGRAVARDVARRLDTYPILDEMDASQEEWDENHPDADEICYSDDPDCGCGRRWVKAPDEED